MLREDNAAARGFYERLGYQRSDVIVLGRRLDSP
jgi:ribosomal protein S18 acetylase RimI-like enzyme